MELFMENKKCCPPSKALARARDATRLKKKKRFPNLAPFKEKRILSHSQFGMVLSQALPGEHRPVFREKLQSVATTSHYAFDWNSKDRAGKTPAQAIQDDMLFVFVCGI